MQKLFLLYFFSIGCSILIAGKSERESDLIPFGSKAKLCQIAMAHLSQPTVATGDLAVIRVDVSYLLHDKTIAPHDLERLKSPYNLLHPEFSNPGGIKVLSQRSRVYGPTNEKMEYIYLVQALAPGKTEFSTVRSHRVVIGQHEMGAAELSILHLIINFRKMLLDHGSDMPSFSDYLEGHMPHANPIIKSILKEMGDKEEEKPWDERLAIADKRIDDWRSTLSPLIYGDYKVSGNALPLEVTKSDRQGVVENQIHQLEFNQLPSSLEVKPGDLIVVETVRPGEVVDIDYAHKYDIPDIRGNGLVPIYSETIERALLRNDHGSNRMKTYFLVESAGPASLEIGKPKISHPYTANQTDIWVKKIDIKVKQPERTAPVDVVETELRSPIVEVQPSIRNLQELENSPLPPGSVLSESDVKAILAFSNDVKRGQTPPTAKYDALGKVFRPFFGETENERLFFLKQCGLKPKDSDRVSNSVNFNLPNEEFFPKLINELHTNGGLATVTNHLRRLRLDD